MLAIGPATIKGFRVDIPTPSYLADFTNSDLPVSNLSLFRNNWLPTNHFPASSSFFSEINDDIEND